MKIITTTPDELDELIKKSVREALSELSPRQTASNKPMTIEQTALYLNLPKATLYQLTHRREIPFRKVGKRLVFLPSEIDSYLQNARKPTRQEIENEPWNIKPSRP